MKTYLALLVMLLSAGLAYAGSDKIYRCGNEYTNTVPEGNPRACKLVEGGNVTVVQAQKPGQGSTVRLANAPASTGQRVDGADQRARDNDARLILEAELKKAEAKQAQLLAEFNNGEPEKQGSEHRNHQKYLDRVAELKSSISRIESDIAGIRREITRAGNSTVAR